MKIIILALCLIISSNCNSQNIIKMIGNDSMIIDYINNDKNAVCFRSTSEGNIRLSFTESISKRKKCLKTNDYVYLSNKRKIPIVDFEEFCECTGWIIFGGRLAVLLDDKYNIISIKKVQ